MNRHLRALGKTFVIFGMAAVVAQIILWLLEAFGAWFPLIVGIAIIFYGIYTLVLDNED